ncbi:uncharacterized protein LOC143149456 [Ptiloglossa arizonensis]|uniref:uncharacterized protein LOC143149456 n=1 Tax=Ptiloglossa arizonensis TaxID=3350558 RepID=UPI003FA05A07
MQRATVVLVSVSGTIVVGRSFVSASRTRMDREYGSVWLEGVIPAAFGGIHVGSMSARPPCILAYLPAAESRAVQHLHLRVSGFHILPLPLGQSLIYKSRSGTIGKRSLESSKSARRRSLKLNACDEKKPFQCQKCGRGFTLKRNKDRHVNYECGHEPRFQCPYCGLRSKQTSPVYAHIRKKHPEEEVFIFDMKL